MHSWKERANKRKRPERTESKYTVCMYISFSNSPVSPCLVSPLLPDIHFLLSDRILRLWSTLRLFILLLIAVLRGWIKAGSGCYTLLPLFFKLLLITGNIEGTPLGQSRSDVWCIARWWCYCCRSAVWGKNKWILQANGEWQPNLQPTERSQL